MLIKLGSSTFGGGVTTFLRLLYNPLFNVLGGCGPNLTSGMNDTCSDFYETMVICGINATVSSMMGVGEGISTLDSIMVLVLDIDMTIHYEK